MWQSRKRNPLHVYFHIASQESSIRKCRSWQMQIIFHPKLDSIYLYKRCNRKHSAVRINAQESDCHKTWTSFILRITYTPLICEKVTKLNISLSYLCKAYFKHLLYVEMINNKFWTSSKNLMFWNFVLQTIVCKTWLPLFNKVCLLYKLQWTA